ncbi:MULTISPECIES: DUF6710 family protein [unclassified Pseudomonas]|uniref:DUF6710 family protein n=1 Tax=unclassified Pseudomonas TaxID=196821 RepID=UPI001B3211C2|nr:MULTISPECIES: DUF6710 family protein [unclassified Pseudomonas]
MEHLEPEQLACFEHLLKTAKLIAETNPRGLVDLIRAILRPLQSEHLLGVAERGQDAVPTIGSFKFFGEAVRDLMFHPDGMNLRGVRLDSKTFSLKLSRDIVLPWAWDFGRYVDALATIGSGKAVDAGNQWNRGYQGPWSQDENHQVELWLPWGIGFVNGGNHSITAGILAGEGEIAPEYVFDMGFLFDELHCDGRYFLDASTGDQVAPVEDARKAAVFEIGRIMRDMNFPAFKSESEQVYNREVWGD